MRVGLLLVALTGCDYLFNLGHVDPVLIDAPADAFDPATQCRNDYLLELWPGSRFRIYDTPVTAWTASDSCNADTPDGISHLAVAQTREKLDTLIGALTVRQGGQWWLGAVQPASATTPIDKWLWVTGEPVDPTLWAAGEPNDGNGDETDHNDQFGFIDQAASGLVDTAGSVMFRALCECDGHAMSPAAKVAIDQNRL